MKNPSLFFLPGLLIGLLLTACSTAATQIPPSPTPEPAPAVEIHPEWEHYFSDRHLNGAFVLYDLRNDRYLRYNPERCAQRFLPASTFKVMNALVGLETGVIADADFEIPWDGTAYDLPAWNQNHTLRTAMKNSVVWYYQELARRVGREKMQQAIDAVGYGNQNIGGNLDSFWLDGELRISPDEQIVFLRRLYQNDLPFSQRTMDTVKEILIVEQTPTYTLRAKTGWAVRDTPQIGWFVGYIETEDNVYFFANNFESSAPDSDFSQSREAITRSILQAQGILP